VGKGLRTGTAKVTAELDYIVRRDGHRIVPTSSLKVHADMEIFQRIALNPKLTVSLLRRFDIGRLSSAEFHTTVLFTPVGSSLGSIYITQT